MTTGTAVTRQSVEEAIRGQNIDAVLVTRLLGVEDVESYRPPIHYDHHRGYFRYYEHSLSEANPGYYRKYKVLTLESNVYDTASRRLIWSMQSQNIDPSTPREVIEEQILLTINTLSVRGLVPASPQSKSAY